MEDKKNIASVIFQNIALTFTFTIIASAISGWMMWHFAPEYLEFPIYNLGRDGLSYEGIAQFFAFSVIVSVMSVLLTEDILLKKVMLLWRCVLLLFLILVTCGLFVVIFRWFPLDNREAWIGLVTTLSGFFVLGFTPMIVKTWLEDRRYGKLLSDYKSKQNDLNEKGDQHD
ncbi:MAG: hypothetical protein FWD03_08255 [Defluviitaleaceae bacterium]|nr:hypothetical protein [Defluviitaleaceae bacterium]